MSKRQFWALYFGTWVALLAVLVITSTRAAEVLVMSAVPDVLTIEHTYDGVVERAGHLDDLGYTGGHLLVVFHDEGDGIFRNGFEGDHD